MGETILKLNNIGKKFPGVVALDHVSLELKKGEVHALLGENGAGKSTLIKILTGAYEPTEGTIEYNGNTYEKFEPRQAKELGITAIYQEFNLVPYISAAQNVFLGNEIKKGIFLDMAGMEKKTTELAREMGVEINPKTKVKDLGVAYMQIVEIIKAISEDTNILIMDEPSAPLTTREIDAMFQIVKRLKEKGITIIYISHRLEELFEICDRVTIMRDGKYICTKEIGDVTRHELIADMVGRELTEMYAGGAGTSDDIIMEAKDLCTDKIHHISFCLKKGEILGFGGLVGAGRTETARALFGADELLSGTIMKNGQEVKIHSPKDAIKAGIGLLPEDRKDQGLVLGMSVKDNIVYSILKQETKGIFLDKKDIHKKCAELKDDLRIKTPSLNQVSKFLSGGNQQKVVLAKWMATDCDVLIFDEPTRGIDVGAKQEIYHLMNELTAQGKSIIMISSEMPELFGMSDRVIVMHEGSIKGELCKDEFDQEKMLAIASGL